MATNEANATAIDLLKLDYTETNSSIGRIDTLSFTIKSWAVSTTTAVAALSITVQRPIVLLAALVPIALFWLLDGYYKALQGRFLEHAWDLESSMRYVMLGEQLTLDIQFGHNLRLGKERPPSEVARWLMVSMLHQHAIMAFYLSLFAVPVIGLTLALFE